MTFVQHLGLYPQKCWKDQYAIVIMSHTKAGYPIVQALLDIGMYVVGVTPQLKKGDVLRLLLSKKQRIRFLTKQVDLNTVTSINMLMLQLKQEMKQVKLFLCLIPLISYAERSKIFEEDNGALLQTIMEASELGVGAVCAAASRNIISQDYSHMWIMRFHHRETDSVHEYFKSLMALGCNAPRHLNVNVLRKKKDCK